MSESTPELPVPNEEMKRQADALLQMVLAAKRELENGEGMSPEEARTKLAEGRN
jgi:hypothetical protein